MLRRLCRREKVPNSYLKATGKYSDKRLLSVEGIIRPVLMDRADKRFQNTVYCHEKTKSLTHWYVLRDSSTLILRKRIDLKELLAKYCCNTGKQAG